LALPCFTYAWFALPCLGLGLGLSLDLCLGPILIPMTKEQMKPWLFLKSVSVFISVDEAKFREKKAVRKFYEYVK
jgi:hypothetical protein